MGDIGFGAVADPSGRGYSANEARAELQMVGFHHAKSPHSRNAPSGPAYMQGEGVGSLGVGSDILY
jgi:hypothetical protein